LLNAVTDNSGKFQFENLYPADSASYFLQARNAKGRSFNVGIQIEEFKPWVVSGNTKQSWPWYFNLDTTSVKLLRNRVSYGLEQQKLSGANLLKEVVIKGNKVIKNSNNLNGPGESDLALDEKDMEKAGKKTLEDVLFENLKGLTQSPRTQYYILLDRLVHLVIDGVYIPRLKPDGIGMGQFFRQYLQYITAEDVKGIEVMSMTKNVGSYWQAFLHPMENPAHHAFIEITTRSGNGAFMKTTPGTYLLKPITFGSDRQFYSPVYRVKAKSATQDTRSSVYWNPTIITDKNGLAKVWFYTTDKPGTYTVTIEGTNLEGAIGATGSTILVK
jgi:hypothetical protein